MNDLSRYVGIAEAARRVGLSVRTVRRHAANPDSPFFRPRGLARVLVNIDDYAAWLKPTPTPKETHHA